MSVIKPPTGQDFSSTHSLHELFLVNYTTTVNEFQVRHWSCFEATHSLYVATERAKELRDMGYRVRVQSVLINSFGKVEI